MRTTVTIALATLLTLAVVPAPARGADELKLKIQVIDGAKDRSPAYVNFFEIFTTTLIEEMGGLRKDGWQNPSPGHWVILLSPISSTTGDILVTVVAIRVSEPRQLPILVAVLSERSEAAIVRTAAKDTKRILVEAAKPQNLSPTPEQKLKTNNPRTKQSAGGFHFYAIVR